MLKTGVASSLRATLRLEAFLHDAHIQTVDEFEVLLPGVRGTEPNFRDGYQYNVAAYRLGQLLGLQMVSASAERRIGEKAVLFDRPSALN